MPAGQTPEADFSTLLKAEDCAQPDSLEIALAREQIGRAILVLRGESKLA
jgi:hypothetical protein